jgi:hypothetical protein
VGVGPEPTVPPPPVFNVSVSIVLRLIRGTLAFVNQKRRVYAPGLRPVIVQTPCRCASAGVPSAPYSFTLSFSEDTEPAPETVT